MTSDTYKPFDGALSELHRHLQSMNRQTLKQFDSILSALNRGDADFAVLAMQLNNRLDRHELMIDAEIINLLACRQPTASDLRMILSISKITTELERIGNELVRIGRLIIDLYGDSTQSSHSLFRQVDQTAKLSRELFEHTSNCLDNTNSQLVRRLAASEEFISMTFNDGLSRQFSLLISDNRLLSPTLKILQIINSLTRINAHCISIADYLRLMIDGADLRRQRNA